MILDYNKNTGKMVITSDDAITFQLLRDAFSVEDKNAKFMQRRFGRRAYMPTRKYAITPTGQCQLGLFYEVQNFLIQNQVTNIIVTENLKAGLKREIPVCVKEDQFKLSLRDYQVNVINRALNTGWGTCVLGTGAGKTFTTAALIETIFKYYKQDVTFKCLVIVPDLGLVNQTYKEFLDCGITFNVSKWTGNNELNKESNVVIVNSQLLLSRFSDNEWIKYIDLLIVDECHKATSTNQLSKIISTIKAKHKYGFTGTLPDNNFEKWSIIGKLGPLLYEKTSYHLRLENYLTDVEIKILELNHSETLPYFSEANPYKAELDFLYSSEKRNSFFAKLSNKLTNNTLILVNHIKHGEILYEKITNEAPEKQVFFIRGDVDVEERDKIKALIETNDNIVCIAISAIFSTGINIKNLHYIVFAAGGKSFIRTVQSIGRGLRLHKNKNKLVIFDICDNFNYSRRHAAERIKIYEKEKIKYTHKLFSLS